MNDIPDSDFAEVVDHATEAGQERAVELVAAVSPEKAAEQAEKTRKKRRSEAQLIADGIREIGSRFEAFALEASSGSIEAALDRGEIVTLAECDRRIRKARAEAREEIRRLLADDNK